MPAKFIPIGEPAHDPERQALRFLVEGLPAEYTVYGNAWLVERSGVIYELDAVVVAPHAIFVVEIKAYRGRIEGTDNDWYIPHPIPSPLKLNRITAQVLKGLLKRENYQAGQVWVEGMAFLSATTDCGVRGSASKDRIHTRRTILAALQDPEVVKRLSNGRTGVSTTAAEAELLRLFTGVQTGPRPTRRVREYEIRETLDHHDTFTELLGRNDLSGAERVLRIYTIPPLATDAQRERIKERARWEAQVLGRLGRSDGILSADPPFLDEAGVVLPLEYFRGITLTTWIERYGPDARNKDKRADLHARTDLWMRIAQTLDETHRQGVVHRLLRPDVILVEDRPDPQQIRVTGFDLAKQLSAETSIAITSVADERLIFAAPEVVNAFSSAEPASDQFSLGAILALLLTGKPLFESTRQLMAARRLMRRIRDVDHRLPLSLDEAIACMVEMRPTDRYPTLAQAITAVRLGRDPESRTLPTIGVRKAPPDAENLEPGTRIGTDYEVRMRLGQGGMSVVYAARHLVSGRLRALKIARSEEPAEDALRGEYDALSRLDHPNIARVIDLTKMVEGRLTMVMERVGDETLRQWLAANLNPEPNTQRRLAEDLLAGLAYLEQQGVTHKDLKPENLLVSDGHLTIIDFSLAGIPEDASHGGTALYRDPSSARWTHATDRFAAALCLFELYAGRHAFEGKVPEPGQSPVVREDDIDPPGLAAFFFKALDPVPEKRFPSARALRDALVVALGDDLTVPTASQPPVDVDATTPLRLTGLPRRALNILARNQVHTAGELLAFSPAQVRAIYTIGTRTAADILAFQDTLRARGITAAATEIRVDPPLVPDLSDSPEPTQKLPLPPAVRAALEQANLPTVGAVASLTRSELLQVPGIGRTRLAKVVEALHQFRTHSTASTAGSTHTLDGLWDLAARPLSDLQRTIIERAIGITGEPEVQGNIATDLKRSQPNVSTELSGGLARLDLDALADLSTGLDNLLDGFGGIVRLDELAARVEQAWPAGIVTGAGIIRLLARVAAGRMHISEVDGAEQSLVARPIFDRDTLRAFAAEVGRIANQWPPLEPEAARRTLTGLLPNFDGDPLALGVRFCEDVQIAETGHLFIAPLDARLTIGFVLDQTREPLELADLEHRVRRIFGPDTPYPGPEHLVVLLHELDCQVHGDLVLSGKTGSLLAPPALPGDPLPPTVDAERTPEQSVRRMLRDAATSRGFRMLVTPPEDHATIGRSVATAISGTWLSFEDAFFAEHGSQLAMLERAERFVAQRDALTEAAEATLFGLLEEHGQPGRILVLGDTALLALCEALDLPRRLYDETLSGSRGFWVLIVPGVIYNRQPRFNEGPVMWHLEGATLPLLNPLPA